MFCLLCCLRAFILTWGGDRVVGGTRGTVYMCSVEYRIERFDYIEIYWYVVYRTSDVSYRKLFFLPSPGGIPVFCFADTFLMYQVSMIEIVCRKRFLKNRYRVDLIWFFVDGYHIVWICLFVYRYRMYSICCLSVSHRMVPVWFFVYRYRIYSIFCLSVSYRIVSIPFSFIGIVFLDSILVRYPYPALLNNINISIYPWRYHILFISAPYDIHGRIACARPGVAWPAAALLV